MSTSVDYWTTEKVKPAIRRRIESSVKTFVKSRRWWAESLHFIDWPGKEEHLAGGTKISRINAHVDDDQFMMDRDLLAILDQLGKWSAEHRIDWEIQLAGQPWGNIRRGAFDASLSKFRTEARKSLGTSAEETRRADAILREEDGQPERAASSKEIKELRNRWSQRRIAAINKFIAKHQSTASILARELPVIRSLPANLLDKFVDGNVEYWDLRGFPLKAFHEIEADHIDFSGARPPKPKKPNLPNLEICLSDGVLSDCRFVDVGPISHLGKRFERCDFTRAKMRGVTLIRVHFVDCIFDGADLSGIEPNNTRFTRCTFRKTRFTKSEMGFTFTKCIFQGCDWKGVFLGGAKFRACDLRGERFIDVWHRGNEIDARCQTEGMVFEGTP